jgi:hypothetical protein
VPFFGLREKAAPKKKSSAEEEKQRRRRSEKVRIKKEMNILY